MLKITFKKVSKLLTLFSTIAEYTQAENAENGVCMSNFENVAVAMVASDKGVLTAIDNKPVELVSAIMEKMQGVECFDDVVDLLNGNAQLGKLAWVQSAIAVEKGLRGATVKQRGEIMKKFESVLKYKKSYIYELRSAGEKLIKDIENGTLKKLPESCKAYLNDGKSPTLREKIEIVERVGEYTTALQKHYIYNAKVTKSDGKVVELFFGTPTKVGKKSIEFKKGDTLFSEQIVENDIEKTHWFNKLSESETIEVSVKFITL